MGKKAKLGFDIDGVLCDFTSEYIRRLIEATGKDHSYHPTEYHYIDEEGFRHFEEGIANGLFYEANPYIDSQIYFTELLERQDEFDIICVTARGSEHGIGWCSDLLAKLKKDTKNWFSDHFPKFDADKIIFSPNKAEVVHKLGIDSFVEDRKDTAEKLAEVCKSFLITRSWNSGDIHPNVRRIESLNEFDSHIEHIVENAKNKKQ